MDFEEFVTLLGPKLTAAGLPDKFNGTDFDSVFWKVRDFVAVPCLPLQRGGVQCEQRRLNRRRVKLWTDRLKLFDQVK